MRHVITKIKEVPEFFSVKIVYVGEWVISAMYVFVCCLRTCVRVFLYFWVCALVGVCVLLCGCVCIYINIYIYISALCTSVRLLGSPLLCKHFAKIEIITYESNFFPNTTLKFLEVYQSPVRSLLRRRNHPLT